MKTVTMEVEESLIEAVQEFLNKVEQAHIDAGKPKLKDYLFKDCPIMVRDRDDQEWLLRYFSHYEDGRYFTFRTGIKSDTCSNTAKWNQARLPIIKELPVNTKVAYTGYGMPVGIDNKQVLIWLRNEDTYYKNKAGADVDWSWDGNNDGDVIAYMIVE